MASSESSSSAGRPRRASARSSTTCSEETLPTPFFGFRPPTGYRTAGDPWGTKSYVPAVFADHLTSWMERGVRVVALEPLSKDGPFTERRVQLLEADGRPAIGACVLVSRPQQIDFLHRPFHDGFRRADEDGCVTVPVQNVVGLEVRVDRVPVAAWWLAEGRWPAEGARVLRLPPIAQAEFVVEGVPAGAGHWARDLLGHKRTPRDGPAVPPTLDSETRALLEANNAVLFSFVGDLAYGELASPQSTIHLPLPVGKVFTLHLFAGHEHRTWTVQAKESGPFRETRSWDELPRAA